MSQAALEWQRFLFEKLNLVAIPSLRRDLQLLDVLVQKGSHGFVQDRGPTIVKIGSLLSLRSSDDHNPEWEKWANNAKQMLSSLRQGKELKDDELFSVRYFGDYNFSIKSTSNMQLSLQATVGGDVANSWYASLRNITYEKFDAASASNLFCGDRALWKPNLQTIKLEEPNMSYHGNAFLDFLCAIIQACTNDQRRMRANSNGKSDGPAVDLWVVTEIYYAKEIKINKSSEYGGQGKVNLASVTGLPISGGTWKVEAQAKDETTEAIVSDKVPFAFKAIKLVYKDKGSLVAKDSSMGTRRPQLKGFAVGMATRRSQLKNALYPSHFLDADEDPHYHMGGLFAQALREGDDDDDESHQ